MISFSRKKGVKAIALTLAIFLGSNLIMIQPAQAVTLKDINQCADYAKPAVERLTESGVISGYEDGCFYPQRTVTRGQMITLIVKSLELDKSITPEKTDTFKDVPNDHWANKFVEIAYQEGITRGVAADLFGVDQTCTREQMITLFVNTFKVLDEELTEIPSKLIDLNRFEDQAQISDWARDPIAFSVYMGLISGTSATTMDPKKGAERQQVAVLTDLFISNQDNIVKDMQAQRLLKKVAQEMYKGQGISNTSDLEVLVTLQDTDIGIPTEFSINAQLTNEMVWPDTFHQAVSAEITGFPGYSQLDMEQYMVDGVLYQKVPVQDNQSSWTRNTSVDADKLIKSVKDAQISPLLLADIINKPAQIKIEDAEVNGKGGQKITYQGQITDVSNLIDRILAASLPAGVDSNEYKDLLDTIKTIKSINFTQVFYVGEDNLIYGNQLKMNIDANNAGDTPIKSIVVTADTGNYKYQDINIVLPPEAQEAP